MSDKRAKKNTTTNNQSNKKASKNRKTPTLRLDNDAEIPAETTYIKDVECFRINDIDIDKIRFLIKNLTVKNIIHISIMCFMNMMINIFH